MFNNNNKKKKCFPYIFYGRESAILTLDVAIIVNDLRKIIEVIGKALQVCTIDDGRTVMNNLFPNFWEK